MPLTTQTKVRTAAVLARIILAGRRLLGRGAEAEVTRGGIRYRLDLREGIDLALYLGVYQKLPDNLFPASSDADRIAMDVGANIGAHTLSLAKSAGPGVTVVAVEPTSYAFGRLQKNLALNPDLADRVLAIQAGLGASETDASQKGFYSRWPLVAPKGERHPKHRGVIEEAGGARFTTLDALMAELAGAGHAGRLGFLKIDVDGNELSVLQGARKTLADHKPAVFMEMAPYVQDEVAGRLESLLAVLGDHGYAFLDPATQDRMPMDADHYRQLLPEGAALDLLALAS